MLVTINEKVPGTYSQFVVSYHVCLMKSRVIAHEKKNERKKKEKRNEKERTNA